MRTFAAITALALAGTAHAGAATTLTVDGSCPGPVTLTITGSPGSSFAIGAGARAGSTIVPGGACAGVDLGIESDGALRTFGPIPDADGDGVLSFSFTAPAPVCGMSFVAIDLATCAVSDVATFGGGPLDPPDACGPGADLLSVSPGNDMALCDDPTNSTCEEDFESLCPVDFHLCTMDEYNARNDGWDYPVPAERALGVIYCRPSSVGAGHFTVPDAGSPVGTLGEDEVFNCYYGSSRPSCTAAYGCNEQEATALCCADSPLCGNGVVDAEEQCDDANDNDEDDCLSTCTWRVPTEHGFSGTNCG